MCIGVTRFTMGCSGVSQRRFSPIDEQIKFKRMNGSPGDPPANRMHILFSQIFTPLAHRLESDPASMAASRVTLNFNHFLPLRTSSRTEQAQARMHGPEINNNSTKIKDNIMALTVSNNGAVAAASYYLGKNQDALQSTIKKLASGKKLVGEAQDPGHSLCR